MDTCTLSLQKLCVMLVTILKTLQKVKSTESCAKASSAICGGEHKNAEQGGEKDLPKQITCPSPSSPKYR